MSLPCCLLSVRAWIRAQICISHTRCILFVWVPGWATEEQVRLGSWKQYIPGTRRRKAESLNPGLKPRVIYFVVGQVNVWIWRQVHGKDRKACHAFELHLQESKAEFKMEEPLRKLRGQRWSAKAWVAGEKLQVMGKPGLFSSRGVQEGGSPRSGLMLRLSFLGNPGTWLEQAELVQLWTTSLSITLPGPHWD